MAEEVKQRKRLTESKLMQWQPQYIIQPRDAYCKTTYTDACTTTKGFLNGTQPIERNKKKMDFFTILLMVN